MYVNIEKDLVHQSRLLKYVEHLYYFEKINISCFGCDV